MENKYQVIAYLKDKDKWSKEDIDASKLTCINYSFAKVLDGVCIENFTKIDFLSEIKRENPHLKSCLSIGGWGADGFSDAVLTEDSRGKFINSIFHIVEKYDFDGVDLDWEYPRFDAAGIKAREEDSENFLLFLRELRVLLDKKSQEKNKEYWLTAAIGAADKLVDTMLTKNGAEYAGYLDYINVMTYDMRSGIITGHHTNLYTYDETNKTSADRSVKRLLSQGIQSEKIIIGGAFYTRVWEGVKDENNGLMIKSENPGTKVVDHNEMEEFIKENNLKYYWDDRAKAPYLFNGRIFASYDDENSLKEKARYVKENHLGGIMFWEYSLDLSLKLLNAIDGEIRE